MPRLDVPLMKRRHLAGAFRYATTHDVMPPRYATREPSSEHYAAFGRLS